MYIVGISRETFQFSAQKEGLGDFEREREKINRDLLYVAMTRAISELCAGTRVAQEDSWIMVCHTPPSTSADTSPSAIGGQAPKGGREMRRFAKKRNAW